MRVRALDTNGDWTFGNGEANYIKGNDAILQNVSTRLKSFKNDWFLDLNANIDWFTILGTKNNKQQILDEVNRVVLETFGVTKINSINISTVDRNARIDINLDTIFTSSPLGVII